MAQQHFPISHPGHPSLPATSTPLQPDRAVGDDDDHIGSGTIVSHQIVALQLTGEMMAMRMRF